MKSYQRKIIDFYDRNVSQFIDHTKPLQNKVWIKKFSALISKKGTVLDLGCAFGRDSRFFEDLGLKTYGVDLSPQMILAAKRFCKKGTFKVMDMMDLKFKDQHFDGIWCNAALLHLKKTDVPKALKEMKRILKNNGVLYLGLKQGASQGVTSDKRYKNDKRFFSYFQKSEINGLLRKNGFKILESRVVHLKNRYTKKWIFVIAKSNGRAAKIR